ncbi:MAG: hypothetical protein FWG18_03270 [Alphaproteobacteria bacterium]|nr:hypothetical protein [Alphaproteobacteria bacterium]
MDILHGSPIDLPIGRFIEKRYGIMTLEIHATMDLSIAKEFAIDRASYATAEFSGFPAIRIVGADKVFIYRLEDHGHWEKDGESNYKSSVNARIIGKTEIMLANEPGDFYVPKKVMFWNKSMQNKMLRKVRYQYTNLLGMADDLESRNEIMKICGDWCTKVIARDEKR